MIVNTSGSPAPRLLLALIFLLAPAGAAQQTPSSAPQRPIQDNSFLVEEAYNQEDGVVQHISAFQRLWDSKSWEYTFTQEWPVFSPKHQLSYTVPALSAGEGLGSGVGDVAINYRYQLAGDGDARLAVSPRVSLLLPTGSVREGRGAGGTGVQFNLPISAVVHERLVTHWNAGATIVPSAENVFGDEARATGHNLGASFIWLAHPRVNLMLEGVWERSRAVIAPDRTQREDEIFISPGIRWAHNLDNGLQIVPGIAVPIGGGRASGERGIILYLSLEHPFTRPGQ